MDLNEILDIELNNLSAPPATAQNAHAVAVVVPDVAPASNNSVSQDAADARNNVRLMIALGTQAITELLALSRDLKTPRSYEVLANMLNTMTQLNQDLLQVHQQEASLVDPTDLPVTGNVNIQNAVFIGTTTELQEAIKQKQEQKKLRIIEAKAISTA